MGELSATEYAERLRKQGIEYEARVSPSMTSPRNSKKKIAEEKIRKRRLWNLLMARRQGIMRRLGQEPTNDLRRLRGEK